MFVSSFKRQIATAEPWADRMSATSIYAPKWFVRGAAWAYREYLRDQSLLALESEAKARKMGLWGLSEAQNMAPWEWRRSGGNQGAPEGCLIKGNINSKGDKIYHAPGTRSYGATKINESKGEQWFCSEDDARDAGWRAPRN